MNKEKEKGIILIKFLCKKIVASLFEIDEDKETAFECKRRFTIRFTNKDNRFITLVKDNEYGESGFEEEMNQIIAGENKLKTCDLNDLRDKNKTCLKDVESDFIKVKYHSKLKADLNVSKEDLITEEDLIIKNGTCFRIITMANQDVGQVHLYCSIDNPELPIEILRGKLEIVEGKIKENEMIKIASVEAKQEIQTVNFDYLK